MGEKRKKVHTMKRKRTTAHHQEGMALDRISTANGMIVLLKEQSAAREG